MDIEKIKTKELVELLKKRKSVKLILEKSEKQTTKNKIHWRLKVTWDKHEAIYTSFRGTERTWTDLNNAVNRIQMELQPQSNQIILIHK